MSGGLMQIMARGAQDRYLTADPEITFFKSRHRRHTNFAVEAIRQDIDGKIAPSSRVSATIGRHGDLVHRMWLEITCDDPSHHTPFVWDSIEHMSIEIGGTRIDRQTGAWMQVWYELTHDVRWFMDECMTRGSNTKMRLPLSFWFCKDFGQALPLIALQHHEVKVTIEFSSRLHTTAQVELWVDYIYLDTSERRRFAHASHEYLIEQVQTTGVERLSNLSDTKLELDFNHPVKELIWTVLGEKEQWTVSPDILFYTRVKGGDDATTYFTSPERKTDRDNLLCWIDQDGHPLRSDSSGNMHTLYQAGDTGTYYYISPGAVTNGHSAIDDAVVVVNGQSFDPVLSWDSDNERFMGSAGVYTDIIIETDDDILISKEPNVLIIKASGKKCYKSSGSFSAIRDAVFQDVDGNTFGDNKVLSRNDLISTSNNTLKPIIEIAGLREARGADVCFPFVQKIYAATMDTATLELNGQERFAPRDADYFRHVQQYQHHTGRYTGHNLDALVSNNEDRKEPAYVYSFALEPEKLQPSGTCNFSRIDNATLYLTGTDLQKAEVFAVNYNVLRIHNGMGGLAYSN